MPDSHPLFFVRKAKVGDLEAILELIEENPKTILKRTPEELRELLKTFWVVEEREEVVGCCCLEIYSPKIAELRTLAVRHDKQGRGYGTLLVQAVIRETQRRKIPQLLAVTSAKPFFERMNFGACLNEKYALFWNGPADVNSAGIARGEQPKKRRTSPHSKRSK